MICRLFLFSRLVIFSLGSMLPGQMVIIPDANLKVAVEATLTTSDPDALDVVELASFIGVYT